MMMGKSQYGDTGNDIRNEMILSARREIFDRHNFSWLLKSATLNMASSLASLPNDYNPIHQLKDVRKVNSSSNDDNIFHQVNPEEMDKYASGSSTDFIFWVERDATGNFQIKSNRVNDTLSVTYYQKPADFTADSDIETIPDYEAVAYKAAAKLWLAKQRDETNHDRYDAIGERKIKQMIVRDRLSSPRMNINSIGNMYDLGYNDNTSSVIVNSYDPKG
jgi:hypothetical protein